MKNKLVLLMLFFGSLVTAQTTITFNGCHNLLDNQNFTFNTTETDSYNKRIYITTPVDSNQPCSGIGTCELKIQWNNTLTRWEFLADNGNGDFLNPFLIYYNTTGNNAAPNPPSNSVGTWVENTTVTEGLCNGNLSGSNSTMTGDVNTTDLSTNNVTKGKIQMFPNPVADYISFSGVENAKTIQVYNAVGQLIKSENFSNKINMKYLAPGVYILKLVTNDSNIHELKFIKN